MTEITDRVRKATDECLGKYESWISNKGDHKSREEMLDALHELRKAAARLEIEMAISERDRLGNNPIPIPSHKASKKPRKPSGDKGNNAPKDDGDNDDKGKRSDNKKAAGGSE